MPDYGEPIPASEVCERIVGSLKYKSERLRYEASLLNARADEVDRIRNDVEAEAARYEKWQETSEEKKP